MEMTPNFGLILCDDFELALMDSKIINYYEKHLPTLYVP